MPNLSADLETKEFNKSAQDFLMNSYKREIFEFIKPQMGGFIALDSLSFSVLNHQHKGDLLQLKCAVFYQEQIGGCNCHDDPHCENGYSEIELELSESTIKLLS